MPDDEAIHGASSIADDKTQCGLVVNDLRYQLAQVSSYTPNIECPACRKAMGLPVSMVTK
jgi:hypothetical protein